MKKAFSLHDHLELALKDFRELDIHDPASWPLIPRATLLLALFFLIAISGWWFLWQEQFKHLETKERQEIQLKEEFIEKKKQAVNLDLHIEQLKEIDRAFGTLLKQLPQKSEVEDLLVEINQAGMGRGLQFELFKPEQEQIRDFYAELPIAVRLTGSYHDLGAFAGDIGALSRIVTLNNLKINAQQRDGSLIMDATAKTFRYLDEEEIAQRKRAEKEKQKGGAK